MAFAIQLTLETFYAVSGFLQARQLISLIKFSAGFSQFGLADFSGGLDSLSDKRFAVVERNQ